MGGATQATEESRSFSDLFDDGPVTVLRWRLSDGWPLTYASGAARDLFGRPVGDIVGTSFLEAVVPDDRGRVARCVEDGVATGADRLACQPIRLRRRDGATVWVSLHPRVDRDDGGAVLGLTATALDVSEREEALRRERIKASQIEKTMTELSALKAALDRHALVSVGDVDGRIVYANPKFCEASGYTVDELYGAPHAIFNSRVHGPDFFADLWRTIRRGEIWQGEIANRRRDGSIFWVATTILPIRASGRDDPDRYVAIRTDITDLKRRNSLLKGALHRAEAADRAKSMFLAQMSHEVRTPLNAILGFSDLMALQPYGPLREGYRDALDSIRSAGGHLRDLIDEVLDLASVDSGTLDLDVQQVDLPALLEDCARFVAALRRDQGTAVRLAMPDVLPALQADPRRLRQMVLNLLTNAMNYTDGDAISLKVEVQEAPVPGLADARAAGLRISIRDQGPGIPGADLARLVQPFERGSRDPMRSQPAGVGLGLPLTRRLAQMHGGDLHLANHPDGGLLAQVVLPLTAVPARPVATAP